MTTSGPPPEQRSGSRLTVNGVAHRVPLSPDRSLLLVLREELGLIGTKYGCGEGECGACSVLLDGVVVRACRTPIGEAVGRSVTTIEGIAPPGGLHPVQRAFLETGAFQCGFCIPGMIVTAVGLLDRNPSPSDEEVRAALQGNLCRCGGYLRILEAVRRASSEATVPGGAPP